MKAKKILNLISKEDDQELLFKKLDSWFSKKPQLIEKTYIFERNIFHLLVLKNKAKVLDKLLSDEHRKEVAQKSDRLGNTILHLAVRDGEGNQDVLNIVLKHFPEMVNSQNSNKNTPFHDAVLFNQLWAVQIFLNHKQTKRSIKNGDMKTAPELAVENPALRQAILNIDLSKIQLLDLRKRPSSADSSSLDSFHESFPLMSSRSASSDSLASPESYDSSSPLYKLQEINLRTLNFELMEEQGSTEVFASKPAEPYSLTPYFKDLLAAHQTKDSSYQELFEQVSKLLCKYHLSDALDLTEFSADTVQEVLLNLLSSSHLAVNTRYKQIQNRNYKLFKDFSSLLLSHNLMLPEEKEIEVSEEESLINSLNLLTACKETPESIREFDFERIAHRTLGLLSVYDLVPILINLRRLYKDLDYHQKLVANYVVWQLFSYQCIEGLRSNSSFFLQMKFFLKSNVDEEIGLGLLGFHINSLFEGLIECNSDVFKDPALINYQIITNWLTECHISQNSFDQLVNRALDFKKGEREYELKLIAQEMRLFTISFYQKVLIKEFGSDWTKAEYENNVPHIKQVTQFFNRLSSYFVKKILSQPHDNIKNALQFMLELAHELCLLDGEKYPDLNNLILICSVLNNSNIIRLSHSFELLSSKERRTLAELEQIVSKEANSKWMREVYRLYRTTLPFLGMILTDVTFARDGNPYPLGQFETVGAILMRILELKTLLNNKYSSNITDLIVFINNNPEASEDDLYLASLRIQPRKTDVINLDDSSEDCQSILEELNTNFLNDNLIPSVLFKGQLHPPIQLANRLISYFSTRIKSMGKAVKELNEVGEFSTAQLKLKEEHEKLDQLIEQLGKTVERIIEVNRTFYVKQKLMEPLSPELYQAKIKGLMQQSSSFDQATLKKTRRSSWRHVSSLVHKKMFFSTEARSLTAGGESHPEELLERSVGGTGAMGNQLEPVEWEHNALHN
ncbi:RasGEF domain-containing protein [Legionella sp. WA2024007413]